MYAGKDNEGSHEDRETAGSSRSVKDEIHQQGNIRCKSDPGVTLDADTEGSTFTWQTERALQTQRHLLQELDTLDNLVKPELQTSENLKTPNFHSSRGKINQNLTQNKATIPIGFQSFKVGPENREYTGHVNTCTSTSSSLCQHTLYPCPGAERTAYFQRHDLEMVAQGHKVNSFSLVGNPPFNQQSWTISSPWHQTFASHPTQYSFPYGRSVGNPYGALHNTLSVQPLGSKIDTTGQACFRPSSQILEFGRTARARDPLLPVMPQSVIQQPNDVVWRNKQLWTVAKQEDVIRPDTQENIIPSTDLEENTAPPQENNSLSQENTTPSQENTTPSQENTTPSQENTTPSQEITNLSQENTTLSQENTTSFLQQKSAVPLQDEKYACKTCGKEFEVESLLQYRSHIEGHQRGYTQTDTMMYRCDACSREFATTTSILYHLRIHKRLRCPKCKFFCSKQKVLDKHVEKHNKVKEEDVNKFICEYCRRHFKNRNILQAHVQTHFGDKPFNQPLSVIQQSEDVVWRNNIHLHWTIGIAKLEDVARPGTKESTTPFMEESNDSSTCKENTTPSLQQESTVPPQDEKFTCKTCGKEFEVKSLYYAHIQDHKKGFTQTDSTMYRCDTCNRDFATPTAVLYHLRIHKQLRCPNCKFSCSKQKVLDKHVEKHNKVKEEDGVVIDENTFICEYCRRHFKHRNNLIAHIRTHNGDKPFKSKAKKEKTRTCSCQTCSLMFSSRPQLKKHYAQHKDHLPIVCPWEGCQLRFEYVHGLTKHYVVHTGENKFVCEYCGQRFKHRNNLMVHIRIHTGEKPFRCDKCDYAGRQQHALDWHNSSHHGIPIPKKSKVDVNSGDHDTPVSDKSKANDHTA